MLVACVKLKLKFINEIEKLDASRLKAKPFSRMRETLKSQIYGELLIAIHSIF